MDHAAKIDANAQALMAKMQKKNADRPSAGWRDLGDVDWDDLDFYIGKCRTARDRDSFDTAINVLTALKSQVLDRK